MSEIKLPELPAPEVVAHMRHEELEAYMKASILRYAENRTEAARQEEREAAENECEHLFQTYRSIAHGCSNRQQRQEFEKMAAAALACKWAIRARSNK